MSAEPAPVFVPYVNRWGGPRAAHDHSAIRKSVFSCRLCGADLCKECCSAFCVCRRLDHGKTDKKEPVK